MLEKPVAGKHSFTMCAAPTHWVTFSVGVFQWVLKTDGKNVKKGKAKVRVKGYRHDSAAVFARAAAVAKELDAGTYSGRKTVDMTAEGVKCS